MKIMSFNTQHCLHHITQEIDFESMANVITDCGADVVGLNEMRGLGADLHFADQVKILAELTGMPYYFFAPAIYVGNRGPYGNGLLSKYPILEAQNILIPDPVEKKYPREYETRSIVKAELEGGIRVLVSHFGLNPDEKENAVNTVLEHVRDTKCILMGDFNLDPHEPLLNPIRQKMVDAAWKFCEEKCSYPSDAPNRKIDYIFVSPDVKVLGADIPAVVVSDHRPHTAVIEL